MQSYILVRTISSFLSPHFLSLCVEKFFFKIQNLIIWSVLPPWGHLYHWQTRELGPQNKIPWSKFFDVQSINYFVPVIGESSFYIGEYSSCYIGQFSSCYIGQYSSFYIGQDSSCYIGEYSHPLYKSV